MKKCSECGSVGVPDEALVCNEVGCGGQIFEALPSALALPAPAETGAPEFNQGLGGAAPLMPPPPPAVGSNGATSGAASGASQRGAIKEAPLAQMRGLLGDGGTKRPTVIVFFGFSRAGKSVYIMRAKDSNTDLGYVSVKPPNPNPANLQDRAKGIPVPGTSGIEVHRLFDGNDDTLFLVDIAGEEFKRAIDAGFQGGTDPLFLEYVAHADGFVFMLPAAETLHPESWDERNPHLIERYQESSSHHLANLANCVIEITQFLQFASERLAGARNLNDRTAVISRAVEEYTDKRDDLARDLRLKTKVTKPALVLLSKADAYGRHRVALAKDGWREAGERRPNRGQSRAGGREKAAKEWGKFFDADPLTRLMRAETGDARQIVRAFAARFKTFRFDFATTVDGHDEYPEKDVEKHNRAIDLRRPHFGVRENLMWVRDEARRAQHPLDRFLNPGVRPAFAIRKFIDADFRKRLSGKS